MEVARGFFHKTVKRPLPNGLNWSIVSLVTSSNISPPFVGQTMPNLSTPLLRLGFAAMVSDVGFLAAVDVDLVDIREQAFAACAAMAARLAAAQATTAASARGARAHAHAMGLPVGGAR